MTFADKVIQRNKTGEETKENDPEDPYQDGEDECDDGEGERRRAADRVWDIQERLRQMESEEYPEEVLEVQRKYLREQESKLKIEPIKSQVQLQNAMLDRVKKFTEQHAKKET